MCFSPLPLAPEGVPSLLDLPAVPDSETAPPDRFTAMQALRQASRVAARQQFRRYAHNAVEEVAKEAEVAAKEANK